MAAGDRKLEITELVFVQFAPIRMAARWQFRIEDKLAADRNSVNGTTYFEPAWTGATTLATVKNDAKAAVIADPKVPARDSTSIA